MANRITEILGTDTLKISRNIINGNFKLLDEAIDTIYNQVGGQTIESIQGIQGIQGVIGFQGADGKEAEQGIQGINGCQGIQGVTGYQGIQGVTGIQGAIGFQGIDGKEAEQGIQGVTGIQGVAGLQGIQGSQASCNYSAIYSYMPVGSDTFYCNFEENKRCYIRLEESASTLNLGFNVYNNDINYILVYNYSSGLTNINILGVTYQSTNVSEIVMPYDQIVVEPGKYVEISVVAFWNFSVITASGCLKRL